MMSARISQRSKVSVRRHGWEAPAFTELKIGTETRSECDGARTQPVEEPSLPSAPSDKLGFSFEWAFPLSKRYEK